MEGVGEEEEGKDLGSKRGRKGRRMRVKKRRRINFLGDVPRRQCTFLDTRSGDPAVDWVISLSYYNSRNLIKRGFCGKGEAESWAHNSGISQLILHFIIAHLAACCVVCISNNNDNMYD